MRKLKALLQDRRATCVLILKRFVAGVRSVPPGPLARTANVYLPGRSRL